MKSIKFALAAFGVIVATAPSQVKADTINGVFQNGLVVDGGFTIPDDIDIAATFPVSISIPGLEGFDTGVYLGTLPFLDLDQFGFFNGNGDNFTIFVPAGSIVPGQDPPLCSVDFACSDTSYYQVAGATSPTSYLASGTIAPTPEPSTMAMLGIGLLGLIGMTWRRKRLA
jgi:hypothetical protein